MSTRARVILVGILMIAGVAALNAGQSEPPATTTNQNSSGTLRRMLPDDLLRLRPIWLTSLSPDGRHVAMVVGRDRTRGPLYLGARAELALTSDVWVVPTGGGPAINVTNGDVHGGSHWLLSWSPQGHRLAALSTQGGNDRVRLLVWTVGQAAGDMVSDDAVYTETRGRRSGTADPAPVVWINDDELLFVGVGLGHDATTLQVAPDLWRMSAAGQQTTVSVLDTGFPTRTAARWSALRKLNVPRRTAITLASIPPEFQHQTLAALTLSPTGRHVAVTADVGPNVVPPSTPINADNERRRRLAIVPVADTPSEARVSWASGIAGPRDGSIRWSPDGSRLLVLGKELPSESATSDPGTPSSTLFVVGIDGRVEHVRLLQQPITAAEWLDRRQFMALSPTGAQGRADWWLTSTDGAAPAAITGALASVPTSLLRLSDGRWVGITQGSWVTLTPSGTVTLDAGGVAPRAIMWPRPGGSADEGTFVIQSDSPGVWFRAVIDGSRVRTVRLDRPADARLVGVSRLGRGETLAVFAGATPSGTSVWVAQGAEPARAIFNNNTFIAEIASGERRLIDYRGGDGTPLKAAVLLPPGYQAGTTIPALFWIYGGTTVTSTSLLQGKSSAATYNDELFAARGIAVVHPSLPMSPYGSTTGEPVNEILQAVLPAVDRLVELGIADPARLAIGGNSYGAYSTYAVITQTPRFKAAIAADGDANLFTSYTAVGGAERYLDRAGEAREGIWWAEASQGRMGETPWQDPLRYLRNSPFFALDRITTPVLIIHNDLDYVPIAHAEEVFVGLDRLSKTARFVRFFGERHGVSSPANLQELWRQMYRWLDQHLLADK